MQIKIFQRHAFFIRNIATRTDAQQNLMRILVFLLQIVRITSYHQVQTRFLRQLHQGVINFHLLRIMCRRIWMTVILHLQIKSPVIDLRIPVNQLARSVHIIVSNRRRNLRTHTARQTNDAFVVLFHDFMVNTRFVVLSPHFRLSHQTAKILKTLLVHRQQCNMETLLIVGRIAIFHPARRHIGL